MQAPKDAPKEFDVMLVSGWDSLHGLLLLPRVITRGASQDTVNTVVASDKGNGI